MNEQPVFRFAPSPNGELHLGHAYSALFNQHMAREAEGQLLLRIEDIDTARCTPALEAQMLHDLEWIGFEWNGSIRKQSEHFDLYADYLERLEEGGLVYPSTLSRSDIGRIVAAEEERGVVWPRDPDGAPKFPGREYDAKPEDGQPFSWRLDVEAAAARVGESLFWTETGAGPEAETGVVSADPSVWGDAVLVRKDTPTSYHLSVVVDDALQGVTHVVRGQDLFAATAMHVLLQELFGLAQPVYHHHGLIVADDGLKLSKSRRDTSIRALREAGLQPADIRRMVGLDAA